MIQFQLKFIFSQNSKAPLGLHVVSCSLYSNQTDSESSLPAWVRELLGLKLASSCVNVTPHLWAWPAATTCFLHRIIRRELKSLCRWERPRTQTLPWPALHCCYYFCPRHFYLCLIEYYFKFSPLLHQYIYIPFIHEDINNWSPAVLAGVVLFVDWAPGGCCDPVVCRLGFTSVPKGRCWDQGPLGIFQQPPAAKYFPLM